MASMQPSLTPEQRAELEAEDLGPTSLAIILSFEAAALLSVILRYYSRCTVTKLVGRDDWVCAVGMVCSAVMAVCQIMQIQAGSGKHQILITKDDLQTQIVWQYWSIIVYGVAITCVKLSILLLYRRIFHASKGLMLATWIVGAIVICFGITIVFSGLFTCVPAYAFWDLDAQKHARCVNQFALFDANAAINIGTDIVIASLPLRNVWMLNLALHQRLGVSLIFAVGWFACAVSILRLHSLIVYARNFSDASYFGAQTAWWSCIEVNTAIMAACLAPLRALGADKWRSFKGSGTFRSMGSTSYYNATGTGQSTDRMQINVTREFATTSGPRGESSDGRVEEIAAWNVTPALSNRSDHGTNLGSLRSSEKRSV